MSEAQFRLQRPSIDKSKLSSTYYNNFEQFLEETKDPMLDFYTPSQAIE